MSHQTRLRFIVMLFAIAFTLLGIEAALRHFDPWGMHYFYDVADIWNQAQPDSNRVAVLPPGEYHLRGWSVTQIEHATRRVPASQGGACQVVFVGDSMTWGHGVNDDETWVNLVAGQLPGTTVINAGFDNYNSDNARRTLADFPDADLFVYLIISNDAEPTVQVTYQSRASMVKMYLVYGLYYLSTNDTGTIEKSDRESQPDRFQSDIKQMAEDKRVIFFGFEGQSLTKSLISDYPVTLLPTPTHFISLVDRHPDSRGHHEIAAAILPYLQAAVAEHCP